MFDIPNDDWRQAVTAVAGLSNWLAETEDSDEEILAMTEPVYVKFNGTWTVERLSLQEFVRAEMEQKELAPAALRRMSEEGVISQPRPTSRGGKSLRVHSLNRTKANAISDDLWSISAD